ncbi:hypothetical protein WJX72_012490 [[Myrmecia] bisecta]|uniref:Uncharacterized protein n=1 Tax=[Myrmecia] bisecta TaxID=41462 RepID=A0AAW1RAK5_9CHLO
MPANATRPERGASLDSFPYEAIIKWLPSTQRSYNPGSADCFDLQLETPRGPRDLRIRAGNPEQVTSILGEIEGTVLQLVAARTAANAGLTAGSGQVADTLHTQSANQPSAVERAQLGSLSGNAGSEAAPLSQRSTRQSRDWEAGRAKVRESLQAGIAGQAHAASEDRPGAEYVAVTNNINRAAEQSSVASSPEPWPEPERGAAAVGSTAYKSTGHGPIEAAEPSSSGSAATPTAHAGRTPSSTYYPATGPMARPGVRQGRDSLQRVDSVSSEGSSSKGDDTQADTATTRQVMTSPFQPQIGTSEADLQVQVRVLEDLVTRLSAQLPTPAAHSPAFDLPIELLAEENALLLQQQASLESQLGQLQAKLLARSGEVVQLSQEAAGLTAQLQERNAALARLERQVERSQAAYESSEEQCGELEMDLARALEALQREQQNADALHQLQSQLVAEAAARQEAAEEAARLSGELGAVAQLREEAEAAIEEVAELRSTTASVEALLEEVQARDAKNQELLAIASAAAEEAVAARNILASKVKIMEAEAAALHSRLADLQGAQQQAERLQAQLDASHKALKAADDELVALRAQVLEQKVAAERNGREQGSLQAQMTELKEACEATGLVSQRTGLAHGSLAALEALHAAEAGRDAAVQRAYNAQMAHEREQRQWELQRQQLETTVAELRHSVMDLEGSLATAKATGASTSRQLDSVRAELTAVQQTRHDVEGSLRLQLAAAQAEAAAAGRLVASHHDGRLDGHARSAAELDRILDAKDALLDKYREEASHATAELASLKAHYDREKQAAQQATSSMESEIQRLRIDISRLAERAEQASAAESALRPNLEDAERRAAQAVLRMTAALAQEEAAVRARKELHLQLDRAQLEQSRAERQRDAALSSNESLRRQCEALQDVALMGQPNRYETSLGGQFGSAEKMLKAKRHKASNKRSRRHADAGRPLQEVQLGA